MAQNYVNATILVTSAASSPTTLLARCLVLASVLPTHYSAGHILRSLRTGPNLLILSLSGAGIMIVFMLPIFLVNLYYGGPVTGVLGAQVHSYSMK